MGERKRQMEREREGMRLRERREDERERGEERERKRLGKKKERGESNCIVNLSSLNLLHIQFVFNDYLYNFFYNFA